MVLQSLFQTFNELLLFGEARVVQVEHVRLLLLSNLVRSRVIRSLLLEDILLLSDDGALDCDTLRFVLSVVGRREASLRFVLIHVAN